MAAHDKQCPDARNLRAVRNADYAQLWERDQMALSDKKKTQASKIASISATAMRSFCRGFCSPQLEPSYKMGGLLARSQAGRRREAPTIATPRILEPGKVARK